MHRTLHEGNFIVVKIGYLIKRRSAIDKRYLIYIALYSGDSTQLISTGEHIKKKEWNDEKAVPRNQDGHVYKNISLIKADVEKVKNLLQAQELDVTPRTVWEEYGKKKKKKSELAFQKDKVRQHDSQSVTKLMDHWIENNLFGYRISTRKSIEESIKAFKLFLKSKGHERIERKELSLELVTDYENYLQVKKKLSNSTHGKRIKHLRWFLKHISFDVSKIKIRTFRRQIIALTLDELEVLEKIDVSENKDYQKAKDMWLLGAYTGQRISDLKRINKASIVGDEIHLRQVKTGNDVRIYLSSDARDILKRYDYRSPRISEQDLNKNIKEVCKKAKIDTRVSLITNKANMNLSTFLPKHELITSHIAGKTFISTVAHERYGLNPQEIAAMCGKNLKTLLSNYFSLPRETAKQKMIAIDGERKLRLSK